MTAKLQTSKIFLSLELSGAVGIISGILWISPSGASEQAVFAFGFLAGLLFTDAIHSLNKLLRKTDVRV